MVLQTFRQQIMKTRLIGQTEEEKAKGVYMIECPGCKMYHSIAVGQPFQNGAQWSFNGNLESPTFEPSLLVKMGKYANPEWWEERKWRNEGKSPEEQEDLDEGYVHIICHSFIRNGQIQFLSDCTHELANQTVELPTIKQPKPCY